MKKIKTLLFIAGMFCLTGVSAQVNLRLDSLTGPFIYNKDTIYSVSITIHNDSTTAFIGKINIGGTIAGQLIDTASIGAIYYPTDTVLETIPGNDTIMRSIKINTDSTNGPSFIIGTSGVVIWPKVVSTTPHLNNVIISDSIGFTVRVLSPSGIDELTLRNLKVYIWGQQLVIQNNGAYPLKNVNLYDVAGKLLLQKQVSVSGSVDMGQFANGVYFAEINFADDTRAVVKVVNAR